MKALFRSTNLIGDALNISPALIAWHRLHEDWDVDFLTIPDGAAMLYSGMGVPMHVLTSEEQLTPPYDLDFTFDCGRSFQLGDQFQIHQTDAYAQMLDVKTYSRQPTYIPTEEPDWINDQPHSMILISPFSRSCSSHSGQPANKMLPWDKWKRILQYLRTLDLPIRVIGAQQDHTDELDLSAEEFICGQSLNRVALLMRDRAAILISIDNGMAHLAASQSCPTFLFYPACLGAHWILPIGNPHLAAIHVDPTTVATSGLLQQLRQSVPRLITVRAKVSVAT